MIDLDKVAKDYSGSEFFNSPKIATSGLLTIYGYGYLALSSLKCMTLVDILATWIVLVQWRGSTVLLVITSYLDEELEMRPLVAPPEMLTLGFIV